MKFYRQLSFYQLLLVSTLAILVAMFSLTSVAFAEGEGGGGGDGESNSSTADTSTGGLSVSSDNMSIDGFSSTNTAQDVADAMNDGPLSGTGLAATVGTDANTGVVGIGIGPAESGGYADDIMTYSYSAGCVLSVDPQLIREGDWATFSWAPDYSQLSCSEGDANCGDMINMQFNGKPVTGDSKRVRPRATRSYTFSAEMWNGVSYTPVVCSNTVTVTDEPIVDLTISSTAPADGIDFSVGSRITFNALMANDGPENLSQPVLNVLEIDDNFDGVADVVADATTASYSTLGVGDTAVVSHRIRSLSEGHYQYRFRTDADSEILENNERNNVSEWRAFRVVSGTCWVANPDRTPRTCSDICAIDGGVPAASPFQCVSGEFDARPAAAYELDGTFSNGISFLWGQWPGPGEVQYAGPNYNVNSTSPGVQTCSLESSRDGTYTSCSGGPQYCYAAGQSPDNDATDLIIGCNCEMPVSYTCGDVPEVPICNDGVDNDSDGLIDYPDDPGCDSPNDDDEVNTPVTITADPTLLDVGDTTTLTWTGSGVCGIAEQIASRESTVWRTGVSSSGSEPSSEIIRATTYTIDCGSAGRDDVTVQVNLPMSINAEPVLVRKGESTTVSWENDIRTNPSERDRVSCSLEPSSGFTNTNFRRSGTEAAYPQHEVIYTYECTFPRNWFYGVGNSGTDSARVQVLPELWET